MNVYSAAAILDFEVYLLMTMKPRMVNEKETQLLEAKLAEHGLSVDAAELIYKRVAEALDDEDSRFQNMKKLLDIAEQNGASVKYSSILWPGFDFNAVTRDDALLESASYRHVRGNIPRMDSPTELLTWSVDVTEFAEHFGAMTSGHQRPLFDKLLPAYEEYEFLWNGERYGAAFSWGLFLYSAKYWE